VQPTEVGTHHHLRGVEHLALPVVSEVDHRPGGQLQRCTDGLDRVGCVNQLGQLDQLFDRDRFDDDGGVVMLGQLQLLQLFLHNVYLV